VAHADIEAGGWRAARSGLRPDPPVSFGAMAQVFGAMAQVFAQGAVALSCLLGAALIRATRR
jgi:hypothetical protein